MKKPDLKRRINQLLTAGAERAAVFTHLRGRVPDNELAHLIVSHADPRRCAAHLLKIRILVVAVALEGLLALLPLTDFGLGSLAFWLFGSVIVAVHALFAWGIHRHAAMAYTAYVVLSVVEIGTHFDNFRTHPVSVVVGTVIGLAIIGFALRVRALLFPDLGVMGPRRVKGEYRFSS